MTRAPILGLALALLACESEPADIVTDLSEPAAPPELPICSRTEFEYAPPPTIVDGLPATPIDMLSLAGRLEFDAAARTASASATLRFRLGEPGMPIFDLRQDPSFATLDGEPLDLARIAHHDFGMGLPAGLRILEVELPACSTHELVLDYSLDVPDAALAKGPKWVRAPKGVYFDVWMSDLHPGRYLESWLPATLPYDQFTLTLEIDLLGASTEHTLISNAEVDPLGVHAWLLEFPPTTRVMSPLIAIAPSEELTIASGLHTSTTGQAIPWTLILDSSLAPPVDGYCEDLTTWLDTFSSSTGEFVHPHMTAYLGAATRSMEYDGALTAEPSALGHEVFHSWWGRGRWPQRPADGWIDEAWAIYSTSPGAFAVEPFDWARRPIVLAHAHPFARATPNSAYMAGRRVFAGLADILGIVALRAAMAEFYARNPSGGMTTRQLEQFLYCEVDRSEAVRRAFHRFVYGLPDEFEPDPGWCESNKP